VKYTEAQQRGFYHKLREKTNIGRSLNEAFSGSYRDQMEKLRNIDDIITEKAVELNPSLKQAKHALKERRYLDLLHFADVINKIVSSITEQVKELSGDMSSHLNEFYGQSEYYDPSGEYSFASINDQLLKSAGIWDALFGTERENAAKALEKMYKRKAQQQKVAMERMFRNLSVLVNTTLAYIKDMGVLRREGDLSEY